MPDEADDQRIPEALIALPPRAFIDRDCLLLAIESSVRVRARAHFFTWTQGALQTVIPHAMLLCAAFDRDGTPLFADVLGVQPLDRDCRAAVLRPDGGLLSTLATLWQRRGRIPLVVGLGAGAAAGEDDLRKGLKALGLSNVAAHGSLTFHGGIDAFFGFADVQAAPEDEIGLAVEIILPHLRAALVRMEKDRLPLPPELRRRPLTSREREVLRLLQHGRSNAEIGAALDISPLTVKNHVQRLLRKLGVKNRTQAVGMDVTRQWRGGT